MEDREMSSGNVLEQVLSCPSLPTPPAVAIKVLELTRDPDASLSKIGHLVENDAALSAKILKTVNSSLFGLPQQCTKMDRALGLLGLNAVKSLVLGFSLVDGTKNVKDGNGLDLQAHWRRAIYSATGARNMALATQACDPDEAFTGAVFQDIGVLAASIGLGDRYSATLTSAPEGHAKLAAHEREALGLGHPEFGAALAERWKLPERYVNAIRYHHEPNQAPEKDRAIARVVYLGGLIAEAMTAAKSIGSTARLVSATREWFGKAPEGLDDLFERVAAGATDLAKLFEKDVGARPDLQAILAEASDQALQTQIAAQRESEELKRKNDELATASVTDGLTKVRNRKAFDVEIARAWEDAGKGGTTLAVLFIDGDKFKSVNDRFGHPAGDGVLVEMARRLSATTGERGMVFRYGGEEFVVLMARTSAAEAAAMGESLRAAIEKPSFDLSKVPGAPAELAVTISVGVAVSSGLATFAALVKAADDATYKSKEAGRNRVTVWSSGAAAKASSEPIAAATPVKPAARAAGSKVRVLMVDDDALAGKLLQMALMKQAGVEVVWAWTASEGVGFLQKGPAFDLVIADMQLGNGTGLEVARAARAVMGSVPVLLISAGVVPESEWRAAGVTAFVGKRELCVNLKAWIDRLLQEWVGRRAA
jgi:diguanylate cyclase (GGDEF)-like protein